MYHYVLCNLVGFNINLLEYDKILLGLLEDKDN
jgi:hypothetical protein